MLDEQLTDADFKSNEIKPDPRQLYRSQLIPKSVAVMAKFAGPGGVIDLDIAVGHFIYVATDDVPTAKVRCSESETREFIFEYVRHFMRDDLFVARARVSMLQHIMANTVIDVQQPSLIERALADGGGDRYTKEVQSICNSADHYALRLQIIRAFTNEAILRVMSDHMVIDGD